MSSNPKRYSTSAITNMINSSSNKNSKYSHLNMSNNQKHSRFGSYYLLQTIGEGEFAKVKLGVHAESHQEYAVKLIRKESSSTDSNHEFVVAKTRREINVLKALHHPHIVRLYDVIETPKYIGIVMEYASGGELFEYILTHRYLKEKEACRLFAQLISGVDYLHRKQVVHRDLKLENLLLDKNRNVIITDFGFANLFENRNNDLMSTSCGSPCYAAPELVVSDGLYVGTAVDIWSCGVILYAMLAGYLPFDDDPSNPDGENINQLYKYIISTPLVFPDHVGPGPRDLLRRMLVPDPVNRCDIEQIKRHPWLYPHSQLFEYSYFGDQEVPDALVPSASYSASNVPNSNSSRNPIDPLESRDTSFTNVSDLDQNSRSFGTTDLDASFQSMPPYDNRVNFSIPENEYSNDSQVPSNGYSKLVDKDTRRKTRSEEKARKHFTIINPTEFIKDFMHILPDTPNKPKVNERNRTPKRRPMSLALDSTSSHHTIQGDNPAQRFFNWFRKKSLPRNSLNTDHTGDAVKDRLLPEDTESKIRFHRGNIDQHALTSRNPSEVFNDIKKVIRDLGLHIIKEKDFKIKVIRPQRTQFSSSSEDPTLDLSQVRKTQERDRKRQSLKHFWRMTLSGHPEPPSFLHSSNAINSDPLPTRNGMNSHNNSRRMSAGSSLMSVLASRYLSDIHSSTTSRLTALFSRDHRHQANDPISSHSLSTVSEEETLPQSQTIYGDIHQDNGGEVRFSIELCKIKNLSNLYIVNIRRQKGHIWSFKFIYHSLLDQFSLKSDKIYALPNINVDTTLVSSPDTAQGSIRSKPSQRSSSRSKFRYSMLL